MKRTTPGAPAGERGSRDHQDAAASRRAGLPTALAVALSTAMALLSLLACSGDRDSSSSKSGSSAKSSSSSGQRTAVKGPFRPGDDSVAGGMLSALVRLDAPRLDGDPMCADYARNLSSLLADMGHQLRRLRDRAKVGASIEDLGRFAVWLEQRAGVLEQISRAKALSEGELRRRHREFAAATSDLAGAMAESFGARGAELEDREIARLTNAADNLVAAVRALENLCQGQ